MQQKVAIGLMVVSVVALGIYFSIVSAQLISSYETACTTEAMICPDGTSVGRTEPHCEFAACPIHAENTDTASTTHSTGTSSVSTTTISYECNQDAKICPDGSSVGRSGPKCEFSICAPAGATSGTIHTTMGQKMTAQGVSITPLEIISDSRCPSDPLINCIWAGTVEIRAQIQSGLGFGILNLQLGKPVTTEKEIITLSEVSPAKTEQVEIPVSSYRFTFDVKKR